MHPLIDFFGEGQEAAAEDEPRAPPVRFVGLTPRDGDGLLELRAAILAEAPAVDASAARWQRISRSAWRIYEERTRREGESAPPLYAWDEPEFDDAESSPEQETEAMKLPTPENMTPRQRACVDAYRELAKELGAKPSPTEVAKRAKLTCSQPSSAVIGALKAAVDRGIELPFYGTAAPRGKRAAKTAAAPPAAPKAKQAPASASPYEAPLVSLRSRLAEIEEERGRVLRAIEAVEALA